MVWLLDPDYRRRKSPNRDHCFDFLNGKSSHCATVLNEKFVVSELREMHGTRCQVSRCKLNEHSTFLVWGIA